MDLLEEKNPLQIETEIPIKPANKFRNNVGRPTKKNEILFSTPPKSIMALLLSQEKDKKIKDHQSETNTLEEKSKQLTKKKWPCEYCSERVFYVKDEYKEHLILHEVYKCDHLNCSYSTKFMSNLKTHKRIHSSEYLYVCDECTFRTKFINSLKAHKRLHKTERPFVCQYCEYKCNSVSNLKKHSARKHSSIPNSDNVN